MPRRQWFGINTFLWNASTKRTKDSLVLIFYRINVIHDNFKRKPYIDSSCWFRFIHIKPKRKCFLGPMLVDNSTDQVYAIM